MYMNAFELIIFCLGTLLASLTILLALAVLSLAAFWKSWREDNDADWS